MTSKYLGVRKERNRFRADIQIKGKKKFLGYHDSEMAAATAYNNAISQYQLNRPLNQVSGHQNLAPKTVGVVNQYIPAPGVVTQVTNVAAKGLLIGLIDSLLLRTVVSFINSKKTFSAYDITLACRESVNKAEFMLTDRQFEKVESKGVTLWSQNITHKEVKEYICKEFSLGIFGIFKMYNSKNIGSFIRYFPI